MESLWGQSAGLLDGAWTSARSFNKKVSLFDCDCFCSGSGSRNHRLPANHSVDVLHVQPWPSCWSQRRSFTSSYSSNNSLIIFLNSVTAVLWDNMSCSLCIVEPRVRWKKHTLGCHQLAAPDSLSELIYGQALPYCNRLCCYLECSQCETSSMSNQQQRPHVAWQNNHD